MDVYAHINFFESKYPRLNFSLDRVFAMAEEMGYDGLEVRAPANDVPYTVEEAGGLAEKHGLKGVTFGFYAEAMSDGPVLLKAETARFTECIRAAAAIGTRYLNCQTGGLRPAGASSYAATGSIVATAAQFEQAVALLRAAGAVAAEEGVTLCLETHPGILHDRAKATKRLIDAVGMKSVKVNLDWVNIWLIGEETEEAALNILGQDVCYVHLKNGRRLGNGAFLPTTLYDGAIDLFNHLRTLRRRGFDGIIVAELAGGGDGRYLARRNAEYLKDVLSALSRETCAELPARSEDAILS